MKLQTLIVVALAIAPFSSATRSLKDQIVDPGQYQIPFNPVIGPGTMASLPYNTSFLTRQVTGFQPEGIHIGYFGPGKVRVTWQTGEAGFYPTGSPGRAPYDPTTVASMVKYGTAPGMYGQTVTGNDAAVYSYVYGPKNGNMTYQSPIIHHVILSDLADGTTYYYVVGNDMDGWSAEKSFVMPKTQAKTIRIGVLADHGQTANSSTTINALGARNPDIIFLSGDLSYADDHMSNSTDDQLMAWWNYYPKYSGPTTDQRRWDTWARMVEPVMSRIPLFACIGNHEVEPQSDNNGTSFLAMNTRYPQPVDGGLSAAMQPMYTQDYLNISNTRQFVNEATANIPNSIFGTDVGPVHVIALNSYAPYGPDSKQVAWFKEHVKTIDRQKTPWLAVMWHVAAYHTYNTHFREADALLNTWEPLLKDAGVDIVLNGHVHAYERSYPVYNYTLDSCAPMYITVGDAGNVEGVYKNFIDTQPVPAFCSNVTLFALPGYQPTPSGLSVISYPKAFNNSFCPQSQPEYSAFREPSFGSGIFEVFNSTHASWTWYRNVIDGAQPEIVDSAMLVKNPSCPKQFVAKAAVHKPKSPKHKSPKHKSPKHKSPKHHG